MSSDQAAEADAVYTGVFPRIFAVIAVLAMLLSTSGLYALTSFTLARRTRDIGIRTAFGAAPPRIIMGVFSRVLTQVGLGVLVGAFSAGLHGYASGPARQS
jgi:putative ABC transport system permease protein